MDMGKLDAVLDGVKSFSARVDAVEARLDEARGGNGLQQWSVKLFTDPSLTGSTRTATVFATSGETAKREAVSTYRSGGFSFAGTAVRSAGGRKDAREDHERGPIGELELAMDELCNLWCLDGFEP